MKRRGIIASLLWAACLFSGFYTGMREFFVLAVILITLMLLALLQALLLHPRFHLDLGSAQGTRGQALPICLEIYNPHPIPILPVRLQLSLMRKNLPSAMLFEQEIVLKGRENCRLEIPAICPHRGEYQVVLHKYYARDVFGFFAIARAALPPATLLSLPRLDLDSAGQLPQQQQENEESSREQLGRTGQLIAESRPYQTGDALHAMHWKKSAARRELFTRLREHDADSVCALLLDTTPAVAETEKLVAEDRLCETALHVLFRFLARRQPVTLLPGNLYLQFPEDLSRAATLLAVTEFDAAQMHNALNKVLMEQKLPDLIYVVTKQVSPALQELLQQFSAQGCVIEYLHPEESITHPEGLA